jgi:hypothetical protein
MCGSAWPESLNQGDSVNFFASGHGKLVNEQVWDEYITKYGKGPFIVTEIRGVVWRKVTLSTTPPVTVPISWVKRTA